MTSKLDELLGRQLFTPFVITTEDGDLISISNPPVQVFRSLQEQLTHHTRTVLRGKLIEIRLPRLLERRGAASKRRDGNYHQKKKLFTGEILDTHSN